MGDARMTYLRACEICGFTTPGDLGENARLARQFLAHATTDAPLRYKVAAQVVIDISDTADRTARQWRSGR